MNHTFIQNAVTSRMGRVSRNCSQTLMLFSLLVTSRMGRVSRNHCKAESEEMQDVTSRMGRVSRNANSDIRVPAAVSHVPHGACE